MKKIEAVIGQAELEAVETLLVEAEMSGAPTLNEVSIVESPGRFYTPRPPDGQWTPCVKLDLIVRDCDTKSVLNIILQHANPRQSGIRGVYITILPIEAMLKIDARQAVGEPGRLKGTARLDN